MANMNGKTVLITGGTDGLGKEVAGKLASLGSTVLVTGRDRSKGETVVRELQQEYGTNAVKLFIADFSSQEEVRHLAKEIAGRYDRLDVLINNAGLGKTEQTLTDDGYEMTFAVNYLAPFLLTHCLLPQLRAAKSSRIINVSSGYQADGELNFDDLHGRKEYDAWDAYSQSKLAIVLFTYELADQLKNTEITVNALEPGLVPGTSFARHLPWHWKFGFHVLSRLPARFVRTPKKGAETYVYLAASPEVTGITGEYFVDKQSKQSAAKSYDSELRKRLWDVSVELTGVSSNIPIQQRHRKTPEGEQSWQEKP
ncbi:SDR family oxidoreductase [Haladaptatus pallidirubidus]|uniref:SDR family oxidoreductase n=1 Tax=Haladaptatus pallidirubidus TaxID=1008152 RepID=A0AAV3UHQ1_9EURY|nr:SDR family oxidoreductase [Haladaptatus pallidirubidus]